MKAKKILQDFVDSMNSEQFAKVREYVEAMPSLKHPVEFNCPICEHESYRNYIGRYSEFFLVSLSHNTLLSYYEANFQMMQHHKYSLSEIDNMMPWEREVYMDMLIEFMKEEKLRHEKEIKRIIKWPQ